MYPVWPYRVDPSGKVALAYVNGYYRVIDTLRAAFPDDKSFRDLRLDVVNMHPLPNMTYQGQSYDMGTFMSKELKLRAVRARPLLGWLKEQPQHTLEAVFVVEGQDYSIYLADDRELDAPGAGTPIQGAITLDLPSDEFRLRCYSPIIGLYSPAIRVVAARTSDSTCPLFSTISYHAGLNAKDIRSRVGFLVMLILASVPGCAVPSDRDGAARESPRLVPPHAGLRCRLRLPCRRRTAPRLCEPLPHARGETGRLQTTFQNNLIDYRIGRRSLVMRSRNRGRVCDAAPSAPG